MSDVIITSPAEYYPNPTKDKPLFNGQMYIGVPDTDAQDIPSNQKQVKALQENGSTVNISQPITISPGGVPVDSNGDVYIKLLVDGNYSQVVLDNGGGQQYYIPNAFQGMPATLNQIIFRVKFTTGILTDGESPDVYESDYYDSNKAIGSGAKWIKDGTTGAASTWDRVNKKLFNSNGDGYTYDGVVLESAAFGVSGSNDSVIINDILAASERVNFTASVTHDIELPITVNSSNKITGSKTTVQLSGGFVSPAFSGTDTPNVEISGLNFISNSFTSTSQVIFFENTGASNLKAPIIKELEFSSIESQGCILIQGPITDLDWVGTSEPDGTWMTWDNPEISNITINNCVLPDTFSGVASTTISAARSPHVSDININNYNQRGISVGYCTDININETNISTTDNGHASTNAHCVYIRTSKRFTLSNFTNKTTGNGGCVRLSRGAYYGAISTGACNQNGDTSSGLMYLGGNNVDTTSVSVIGNGRTLFFGPHGSDDGVSGDASASFSDANNNTFSGCTFESGSNTVETGIVFARGIALTEPRQPVLKNNLFSECVFRNDTVDAEGIIQETGELKFDNCTFAMDEPSFGISANRDNRVPSDQFSLDAKNCDFISETNDDGGGLNGGLGRCGIIYEGNTVSLNNTVSDNKFVNWYLAVANANASKIYVNDNEFYECLQAYRADIVDPEEIFFNNNFCRVESLGAGQQVLLARQNPGASEVSSISHNTFILQLQPAIRFSGTAITGFNSLHICHNNIYTTSRAFRDIPDLATIAITHNLATEVVSTTIPANPTDQFNVFL